MRLVIRVRQTKKTNAARVPGHKLNCIQSIKYLQMAKRLESNSLLKFPSSCTGSSNEVRKELSLWLCCSRTNYQTSLLLNHGRKSIGDCGGNEGKPPCLSEREQIMDSSTSLPQRQQPWRWRSWPSATASPNVIWLYMSKRVWLSQRMFYSSDDTGSCLPLPLICWQNSPGSQCNGGQVLHEDSGIIWKGEEISQTLSVSI